MNLILNEMEFVRKSLEEGYIDKKPSRTLSLLAKYYISQGNDKEHVKAILDEFMTENYRGYNSVKWSDTLERIIRRYDKQDNIKMINITSVNITENEITTIRSINNLRLEKVTFVLLVYAKIYNQINNSESNWVNCKYKDIFSDCKIALSPQKQALMIHKLVEMGLVETSRKVDCNNIHVKYVDENSDVALSISDFRNYVYEYLRHTGDKKIKNCDNCEILITITGKNHHMCNECWNKHEKERQRIKWHNNKRKYRNTATAF